MALKVAMPPQSSQNTLLNCSQLFPGSNLSLYLKKPRSNLRFRPVQLKQGVLKDVNQHRAPLGQLTLWCHVIAVLLSRDLMQIEVSLFFFGPGSNLSFQGKKTLLDPGSRCF